MFGTIHYIILLIRHVLQCLTPNHKTVLAVSHVLDQFKSHGSLYAISEEQSSVCILCNQRDATYTTSFIIISALHVSGSFSAHH